MGERKSMEEVCPVVTCRCVGSLLMLSQIRTAWTEQSVAIEKKRAELRKLEESLIKSKKDTEKQATKLKSMSTSSGNAKEAELQNEIDKCMVRCPIDNSSCVIRLTSSQSLLKCSTCHMNMRNTVITKCMHCKSLASQRVLQCSSSRRPQRSASRVSRLE